VCVRGDDPGRAGPVGRSLVRTRHGGDAARHQLPALGRRGSGTAWLHGAGQRAYANVELRSNRLLENSLFDNQGWRAVAGLDWRTAGLVSGELRVLTDRSLAAFDTGTAGVLGEANLVTLSQAMPCSVSAAPSG
jgi:hypothetical protein